ncbi:hypothetical protein L0222_26580 [bacterium]|nr:hypothetical protein [bacterium]MCI0603279.1 hypothetical protein [bacterium]
MKAAFALLLWCFFSGVAASADMDLVLKHEIPSNCREMTMTMIHDAQGKDFLYVASKDGGLKIYNIQRAPVLVKTIPIRLLHNLHVMNLSQTGDHLYLALGNHFGLAVQNPGFAIIDVSTPESALVVSVWSDPKRRSGAGALQNAGIYLYLGAMKDGLMIFDISDKKNIKQVSIFVPDIHFPDRRADQSKINARGLDVKDGMVYLCYDAGGVRIIDVKNHAQPREVGRYSNPALNGRPRAYNNLVVDGSLLYVTTDYCGLEVLQVNGSGMIRPVSWWNPWKCPGGALQWFKSDGHSNEIAFDKQNKLIYMSTGKSDLNVVSVADPERPVEVFKYGGPNNGLGTWGVSRHGNEIYLSYICAFIPFQSNWTGVKILREQ